MTITCPACNGGSIRELTPGFYECTSPIDASIPPGAAGNPGWLHGSRPCGHRFQAGPASATEPCWCGRHSIGRCRDCNCPLCGLHGTETGELLCGNCVTARMERRAAEAAEQAARHERATAERGRDLSASLAECTSARGLLALLSDRGAAVPDRDALKQAWTRVADGGQFEATHEVVALAGRPRLGSPFTSSDFTRRGSWSETGQRAPVWRAPDAGREREMAHTNWDVWVGAHGDVWWGAFPHALGFGKGAGPTTRHFVLRRGERLRLQRGHATYQSYHVVQDGVHVSPTTPEPDVHARVIEVALKHGL